MLGIAGVAFSEYGYMLTLSNSVHSPYWSTLLFGVIAGGTGYIALVRTVKFSKTIELYPKI